MIYAWVPNSVSDSDSITLLLILRHACLEVPTSLSICHRGQCHRAQRQAFFALCTAGWRPILAHPERHRELARRPERIECLREQDLMLQVNAGSLVGQFGRRAMDASTRLIERGWTDFVASVGHDVRKRRLIDSCGCRATERAGENTTN
ncbi:MAG: CpsB/CapC family capsule biosynthesis tyrosine phosphatase, partial [Candidatus Latescibacterota bacterium]|nr:CpsB/CapC family capsule biosynthesis tyrosine phosphatase [Candidatus Latescibacterota bacterium]